MTENLLLLCGYLFFQLIFGIIHTTCYMLEQVASATHMLQGIPLGMTNLHAYKNWNFYLVNFCLKFAFDSSFFYTHFNNVTSCIRKMKSHQYYGHFDFYSNIWYTFSYLSFFSFIFSFNSGWRWGVFRVLKTRVNLISLWDNYSISVTPKRWKNSVLTYWLIK